MKKSEHLQRPYSKILK